MVLSSFQKPTSSSFPNDALPVHPIAKLNALEKVRLARVTVKALQMVSGFNSDEEFLPPVKNTNKKRDLYVKASQSKPPVPAAPSGKKKNVGYAAADFRR